MAQSALESRRVLEIMRLSRKLTLALVLGIVAVMATYAWVQLRHEVLLSDADLHRGKRIGLGFLGMVEAAWKQEGPRRAEELVEQANRRSPGLEIRLIPFGGAGDLAQRGLTPEQGRELEAGHLVTFVREEADGSEWQHAFAAIDVDGHHPALVEVFETRAPQQSYIRTSHTSMALATAVIILICGLIITALQHWLVGRPIQLLRDKARRAGAGDFSGPLHLPQRDEMGELAAEINAMCDEIARSHRRLTEESEARLAALDQLRHAERLATVGRLAAGVAHELGTPLNVISARAEMLEGREMPRPEVEKNAAIIGGQAERMSAIIQQLLDFSRRRSGTPGLTNIAVLVARALDLLSSAAERAKVCVECATVDRPMFAHVDPNQMLQALTNVILNAIQAMPQGGALRVAIAARSVTPPADVGTAAGDHLCITVEDEGVGIAPERLSHIFEPFFTTKATGEGTGLGLAVAHGIVAEHGGWIAVESEVGKGSRFFIYLPLSNEAARAEVA